MNRQEYAFKALNACLRSVDPYNKEDFFREFTFHDIHVCLKNNGFDVSKEELEIALEAYGFMWIESDSVRMYYVDYR